jgi:hypothetical protein
MMLNGNLIGTTATFGGAVTVDSLSASRLNIGTSAGGVTNPNLIVGNSAMPGVQSGNGGNSALGIFALNANTSGQLNTATGLSALMLNTTGSFNTASGFQALVNTTTGYSNSALGTNALLNNTTGYNNAALGTSAGVANTTGNNNTFLGVTADASSGALTYATAIGSDSRVATSNTLALGRNSTADQVVIGTDTRNDTYANTKLYVNGVTNLNGNLRATTATFTGAITANSFSGNGSALTNLNASNFTTGIVPVAQGGTGLSTVPTNGQLLIGNGTGYTLGTLTAGAGIGIANAVGSITISNTGVTSLAGTANQVNVSGSTGAITISLPQAIATTSTPTFGAMTLSGGLSATNGTFSGNVTSNSLQATTFKTINSQGAHLQWNRNAGDGRTYLINQKGGGAGGISFGESTTGNVYTENMALSAAGNLTVVGAVTANSFSGNGSGLTNLNASNLTTGTVSVARGGTGVDGSAAGNGTLLIGNGAGYTLANLTAGGTVGVINGAGSITLTNMASSGVASITGTADQIIASASSGAVTLSLPQSIATTSTPTFRRLILSDNTGVSNANVVLGSGAMQGTPSGNGGNTALGTNTLNANTSGYFNTAVGFDALKVNNTGFNNTAVAAFHTLLDNTSGYSNTAVGSYVMEFNTSGYDNTAIGAAVLYKNSTGYNNTGIATDALQKTTIGTNNTAIGDNSLITQTSANNNAADGQDSLKDNSTGSANVAMGQSAGFETSAGSNTNKNTTGSNNTFVGSYAMPGTSTQRSYATALGSSALVTTSNTVVLGRTTDNVVMGATGDDASGNKLQVSGSVKATAFNTSSDRRLKNSITELDSDNTLTQLEKLKAYHYRFNSDPSGTIRYGVIAQEVATLFPHAVSFDGQSLMAVDYGALGAIAASGVGYLSTKVSALDEKVKTNTGDIAKLDTRVGAAETKIEDLEGWKTKATTQLDDLQAGLEKNVAEIAKNALLIAGNTAKIESLEVLTEKMSGRLDLSEKGLAEMRSRLNASVQLSEDGSTLNVMAPNLVVSNLSSQRARVDSLYAARLEAEMARIAELEVNDLRANSATANTVQAEQMNTGSASVYAGVGMPALLFAAKADGHYTVNASAVDGSYATATVIVNAGQARVFVGDREGIELFAEGNMVKVIAAGKSIKASWIKMG